MALEGYSKLHIDITDDGTIKEWTGQLVSAQKQVRFLRQELSNTSYNEAQRQSVRLLLADAQMGLQATQTRSRELFGSLSLLPGPMGNFFGTVQMTLVAFRELSQLSFSDLKSQFEILKASFSGEKLVSQIPNNITNATETTAGNTLAATATGAALGTGAKDAIKATNDALKEQGEVVIANSQIYTTEKGSIDAFMAAQNMQFQQLVILKNAYPDYTIAMTTAGNTITNLAGETRALDEAEIALLQTNNTLKITEKGLIEAIKDLTIAQKLEVVWWNISTVAVNAYNKAVTFTTNIVLALAQELIKVFVPGIMITQQAITLLAATISTLGFAGIAAGIGIAVAYLYEWITGTLAAEKALKNFNQELEDTEKLFELNTKTEKRYEEERKARTEERLGSEKQKRTEELEALKKHYNLLTDARKEADKAETDAMKLKGKEGIDALKKAQDERSKLEEEAKDTMSKIQIKTTQDETKTTKEKYEKDLKELDAKLQLEFDKEQSNTKRLVSLYQQRNKLIDDNTQKGLELSKKEQQERLDIQQKKINDKAVSDKVKLIQQEIDLENRKFETLGKDTDEYFESKLKTAALQRKKEEAESEKIIVKDQASAEAYLNSQLNAKTKYEKSVDLINKEKLQAAVTYQQNILAGQFEKSSEYYDAERKLEEKSFDLKKQNYDKNSKELEALAEEHKLKMIKINQEEENENLKTFKKYLDSAKNYQQMDAEWWTKWDTQFFEMRRKNAEMQHDNDIKTTQINSTERKQIDQEYANSILQINEEEAASKEKIRENDIKQAEDTFTILLSLANTYAKSNKDIQHTLLALQSAAQIARIISSTETGLAAAKAELAAVALIPGVGEFAAAKYAAIATATRISEAISIASVLAATAAGFAQIDSSGAGGGNSSSVNSGRGLGKNYGTGGLISGASHSQGGVPINAEGGEAIMSRGAVTMFAPLLSLMNQAGGGTAFSQGAMGGARYDAPKAVGGAMEQPIIKTYVVEGDMTTMQHKAARLKSLSTL